eukprot:gnl/TRDRNA2_/TRDRNA2_164256_c0_seq2.p1 gnl/TRDRNA2_/TRDRNA2_164256_c0~~gnl/TRDRNA2_/TRDRNA2_164256_c0_seq2.p1  ORF type:complete len:383 (-),score=164.94 gnl/TRDRNA2_/TRDRNA2_164256_c0_seq2:95-1243(-)
MPAQKRVASKAKAAPKAKAAKADVDPIFEEVAPVTEIVGQAELPDTCKEMLEAMAPYCLKTPDGERTELQQTMVGILEEVATDVQARQSEAVAGIEKQLAEIEVEQVTAVEALEAANKLKCEQRDVKNTKDTELQAASGELNKAKSDLEAETKKQEALGDEHKENVARKEQLQQTAQEKWAPLKDGSFPGKDWRERNKAIDAALKPLENVGLDGSLLASLPVALKTKADQRGMFAQKALEFGEAAFDKQIKALEQQIANVDNEAAERARAVEAAKAVVETAEGRREECTTVLSEAKKLLEELTKKHAEAQKASKEMGPKAKALEKSLQAEKKLLENIQVLSSKFQELRERKPAPVEEAADMEVEAPAAVVEAETPAVVEAAA